MGKSQILYALVLAIGTLFSQAGLAADEPSDCGTHCQQLRQEFRYVVYVGKQIYCYWDLKQAATGTDYDGLAARLEASITDNTSNSQYYRILQRWAASFHDGHVNVFPADLSFIELYSAPVRVEVMAPATDHEKVVVVSAENHTGVAVGDEVTAINGVSVSKVLDEKEALRSGSTARMRRFFAGMTMLDAVGDDEGSQPLTLTIRSFGTVKDVQLAREVQIPPPETSQSSSTAGGDIGAVKVLPGNIGYVRINGFSGDDEAFESIMDRLSSTSGLVIDLRRNGGGDLSGNRILARLATQSITRYKQSERWSDFLIAERPDIFLEPHAPGAEFADWHDVTVTPDEKHYGKPVVALTSPYCFSACDTFSASLRDNKLATFIGEGTGGGTGTPHVFQLPVTNLYFRYSVVRGLTPSGAVIEGQGTLPDIYLEPAIEDRIDGTDSQLERAVRTISSMNNQRAITLDARAMEDVGPIGTQSLEIAPTYAEMQRMLKIKTIDEQK